MTKKKEGRPKKHSRKAENNEEYRKRLKNLMEDIGDWNINYNELADKWNIPSSTMYDWKDKILEDMEMINPSEFGREAIRALKFVIRQCNMKIKSLDQDVRDGSISKREAEQLKQGYHRELRGHMRELRENLESYGYKEKVPERFEHSSTGMEFIINNQPLEEEGADEEE